MLFRTTWASTGTNLEERRETEGEEERGERQRERRRERDRGRGGESETEGEEERVRQRERRRERQGESFIMHEHFMRQIYKTINQHVDTVKNDKGQRGTFHS